MFERSAALPLAALVSLPRGLRPHQRTCKAAASRTEIRLRLAALAVARARADPITAFRPTRSAPVLVWGQDAAWSRVLVGRLQAATMSPPRG